MTGRTIHPANVRSHVLRDALVVFVLTYVLTFALVIAVGMSWQP